LLFRASQNPRHCKNAKISLSDLRPEGTKVAKLDLQLNRLADCDRIYHEKASAASAKNRPELQKALDFVRDEDVFVVTKLDRLARSVVDLAGIVQKLEAKKVDLLVLDQGIDTMTIYGRLHFNILAPESRASGLVDRKGSKVVLIKQHIKILLLLLGE